MKMPAAHIWKTATEASRERKTLPDGNLHIRKTMRDLYVRDKEEKNAILDHLLEELRKRELKTKK